MRHKISLIAVLLVPTLALFGCASQPMAPAQERSAELRVVEGVSRATQAATSATAPVAVESGPEHIVKKGDTLYGIALDNGLDYKDLARWNALENPNRILIGQRLRLSDPASTSNEAATAPAADGVEIKPIQGPAVIQSSSGAAPVAMAPAPVAAPTVAPAASVPPATGKGGIKTTPKGGKQPYSEAALAALKAERPVASSPAAPAAAPVSAAPAPAPTSTPPSSFSAPMPTGVATPPPAAPAASPAPMPTVASLSWTWPAAGKVITTFSEGSNKGIDIAGKIGEPVNAAAAGKVSYVGASLRGYGKMIVIKHSAEYLSVYAHNSKILVTEGQSIATGQKIAEIGDTDAESPRLHFEIRRMGKPVDPAGFLPPR